MTNRESSEENYSSEIARINDLVLPYLYDIGFRDIEREVRVNLGSRLIYVDIVAYLDNTMDTPVAIAEVRRNINSTPSLLDPAVQQAFSASAALGDSVKYLLISDGIRHHWFERVLEKQNLIVLQTHPQIDHRDRAVFQPNFFVNALIPVSDPALYRHLLQSAIEIMKKEGLSFSIRMAIEINKIIIAKLYDESQNQNLDTKDYKFSVNVDNPINIPEQIHALYQNALVAAGSQPLEPDQWNLSPNTLTSIVRLLEPYYISSVNPEVLDRTFWEMFPNLLRRDESIYTTPRPLASLVSQLAHLGAKEKLIDPACGSGLLLLETYRRHGGGLHAIDIQNKIGSSGYVTGIEVNSEVAKLAATNFVISGLAHSSIVNANSLDIQNLENLGIKLGGYDVVVSSPPFGVMSSKDSNYLDYYETAKVNSNNHVEVLFLELSLLLLRPGGRAVLLVPDSLLSSPHFVSVRKWLLSNTTNRAIISLPPESFALAGHSGKASIIMLEKRQPKSDDENVLIVDVKYIGYDRLGDSTRENDIPKLIEVVRKFREGIGFSEQLDDQKMRVWKVPIEQIHADRLDVPYLDPSGKQLLNALNYGQHPIVKLKQVAQIISGRSFKSYVEQEQETAVVIQAGAVRDLELDLKSVQHISRNDYLAAGNVRLNEGDVLITTTGQYLGRAAAFVNTDFLAVASGAVTILRPNEQVDSGYLAAVLSGKIGKDQISRLQAPATAQPYIRRSDLGEVRLPLPPIQLQKQLAREVIMRLNEARELQTRAAEIETYAKELVAHKLLGTTE